jgi:hypothetical protein
MTKASAAAARQVRSRSGVFKLKSSKTVSRKCERIKKNGQGCEANAMTNSKFCFFHDPSKAKERATARRAGGVERSRRVAVLPPDTPDRPLRSSGELLELLRDMINKILRGELDPKIGYAVGYLATIQTKVREQSEMEGRIAALEASFTERQSQGSDIVVENPQRSLIRE